MMPSLSLSKIRQKTKIVGFWPRVNLLISLFDPFLVPHSHFSHTLKWGQCLLFSVRFLPAFFRQMFRIIVIDRKMASRSPVGNGTWYTVPAEKSIKIIKNRGFFSKIRKIYPIKNINKEVFFSSQKNLKTLTFDHFLQLHHRPTVEYCPGGNLNRVQHNFGPFRLVLFVHPFARKIMLSKKN